MSVSKGRYEDDEIEIETYCLSTEVPAYLRFNAVELEYEFFLDFEQMKLHLEHLKNALIGSKFYIKCHFEHHRRLESSSVFLDHFVKEVLSIINTDTLQSHDFNINVESNLHREFDVREILTEIIVALPNSSDLTLDFELEMPINTCSSWQRSNMTEIWLPVRDISSWLTRKTLQGSGKKGEQNMMKKRCLFIYIDVGRVVNYAEMSEYLEKVL